MTFRLDEFSHLSDGVIDATDRGRWLEVGFGVETPSIPPSTIRFRIDEFARTPDTFIDVKDRTRFTCFGFDRATIVGPPPPPPPEGAGGGIIFPLRRKAVSSKDLPNLDYADPHLPVSSMVKYVNESVRRVVQGQNYGASWQGSQFILQNDLLLVPSDYVTVCQVFVTVLANVSLTAELYWTAVNATDVNWQFLRDNKILFVSAGHHLADNKKTVTPISQLYLVNEPPGDHTYALQLRTVTENVTVYNPTRLLVIA